MMCFNLVSGPSSQHPSGTRDEDSGFTSGDVTETCVTLLYELDFADCTQRSKWMWLQSVEVLCSS